MQKHDNTLPRIAGIWAFLESIVFYVVPEFFLAPAVIARPKQAWHIMISAAIGSVIGMAVLSVFVLQFPDISKQIMLHIPFTTERMFDRAIDATSDPLSVFFQSFGEVPAKVWVWSAVTGMVNFTVFFLMIALGRLFRFFLVTMICLGVEKLCGPILRRYALLAFVVYAVIFFAVLWRTSLL